MKPSYAFDPDRHEPGSIAAQGRCSYHAGQGAGACTGEAVVSFEDGDGQWQTGCSRALEELVETEQIHPLGEKA